MTPGEYASRFGWHPKAKAFTAAQWILRSIERCRDCWDRMDLLRSIHATPALSVGLDELLETGEVSLRATRPRTSIGRGDGIGVYVRRKVTQ